MVRGLSRWRILLALVFLMAGTVLAEPVMEVRIVSRDRTRIDASVVRSFISMQQGDELSREALSRDIRAMERSGRFSYAAADVEPAPGGWVVMYIVEIKPRIGRIVVDGAQYLSNRKVRELLEIGPGDPVDDAILATKSQAVREHYRKRLYPFARLSWTIVVHPETGIADVSIQVDEGRRAKIKKISFTGNEHIPARELRGVMQQKRRWFLSWITGSGRYDPDVLSGDLVLLRRAYTAKGFLDVKIGEPALKELGEGRIEIVIPVEEGARYFLGNVSLSGVSMFSEADVKTAITNRPGDVASSDMLNAMTRRVRDYYGSRGYIETGVAYQLEPNRAASEREGVPVVDARVNIREGHLAYIRDIRFRGNTKTRDKVLRREVTVYPGEIMNEVKLRTSENRLRNLGYYSAVTMTPEPTADPARYDAVFDVVEQNTGQFVVGAGFSSIDNLIGYVELQQGNFDIANWPPVGGGQKLRLRASAGSKRNDVELSLTEPWFLDRQLSLGGTLFHREAKFYSDEYEQRNTGGRLTLGVPLARFTRLNFIYGLEQIDVYDVDESASDIIKAEEGDRIKSSFTTELIFDTRDNAFIPTRGTRAVLSAMVAGGPLQGDTEIYGAEASVSQFFPMWLDHVLSLRGVVAGVDFYGDSDRVPIFDRLFLGGARNLRGFKYRDVGPKDEDGEPIGGRSMWYLMAEYTVPVAPLIRLAAFYDIGMVYEEAFDYDWSSYNSDVGIGVRFDIRGFPLRFDYAWPLETDEFNDRSSGRFQFSIGYSF